MRHEETRDRRDCTPYEMIMFVVRAETHRQRERCERSKTEGCKQASLRATFSLCFFFASITATMSRKRPASDGKIQLTILTSAGSKEEVSGSFSACVVAVCVC